MYGVAKYGYSEWMDKYIIFSGMAHLISTLTSPIIGRLSDRYGRKKIILISVFIQMLPYIPLAVFGEEQMVHFLYNVPIMGLCGIIIFHSVLMLEKCSDILIESNCKIAKLQAICE